MGDLELKRVDENDAANAFRKVALALCEASDALNKIDFWSRSYVSAPYVTVWLAAALTGLSENAIRRKIQEGKWLDGREIRRSPDGRVLISIVGYAKWVESGR